MELTNTVFDDRVTHDPEIFALNKLPAHSDHLFYQNRAEVKRKQSSLVLSLNGDWRFHYANNLEEVQKDFVRKDFDFSSWESIKVPSSIQLKGYGKLQYVNMQYPWDGQETVAENDVPTGYNPVGQYICSFLCTKEMTENRVVLHFGGVESGAAVWLNGSFVGYGEDSFTPTEFDVTGYIQEGENILAVQVFQWTTGSILESQDFFRMFGIFREVELYILPKEHLWDMEIEQELDENYENASLQAALTFFGAKEVEIYAVLRDQDGKVVGETKGQYQNGDSLECSISQVQLWSAEIPYCYELSLEIYDHEKNLKEIVTQQVGFRKIEIKNGVICINGKRLVIHGVNRHEMSCWHGRSLTAEEILGDILILKANNINAVRTSHYPNQSLFYRLCDEYGIYVMDEANLESHANCYNATVGKAPMENTIPGSKPQWRENVLDRANSMYQRDKNHPSIVAWSCGNESCGGKNLFDMSEFFRQKDSGRFVHYEGITWDNTYPKTSDVKSFMYGRAEEIRKYLEQNKEKPVISCEFSHSMGNSTGGLDEYIKLEEEYQQYQGGFIWDFVDQAFWVERNHKKYLGYGGDFNDRPNDGEFSGNGLLFADRRVSPKMQEVRYLYQNIKLLITENRLTIVNKNLFTGTKELTLKLSVQREGVEKYAQMVEIDVLPLSQKELDITFLFEQAARYSGICTVNASLLRKEDTKWEKAGAEVAFGQYVLKASGKIVSLKEKPGTADMKKLSVVEGNFNLGVSCGNIKMLFSKAGGGLTSYCVDGKELCAAIPKPNFWRAPTNNDIGNGMPLRCGIWKIASKHMAYKSTDYKIGEDEVEIAYSFHLFAKEDESTANLCQVIYRIENGGEVHMKLLYQADWQITQAEMPEFGLLFHLPAACNQVHYFGNGPEENYVDRCRGSRLGWYSYRSEDNLTPYLTPQECGNRTGVYRARVTDEEGTGIEFSSEAMNFSVLPYTPEVLENANHVWELPAIHDNVVRASLMQMGVGGDDSWGSMPHDQYLLKEPKTYVFELKLTAVEKGMG